jgi:hypothetical protein
MTLNVSPHRTAVQEQQSIVEENIHKKSTQAHTPKRSITIKIFEQRTE